MFSVLCQSTVLPQWLPQNRNRANQANREFGSVATKPECAVGWCQIQKRGTDGTTAALKWLNLQPGSAATRSGLAANDIILSINRQPVKNLKKLEQVVTHSNGALLIKLLRNNRMLFLVLQ